MKVCFPATFVAGVMFCLIAGSTTGISVAFAQAPNAGAPGVARPPAGGVPAGGGVPAAAPPATAAPQSSRPMTTIAVVDIAKIFKGHIRFNQMMADIKKDIEEFDGVVKAETAKLKTMAESLQSYKTGSLEYKAKEEEIARLQSDLQVKVSLKKKELLEQEARVYFNVYREVEATVARFAQANNITMVLRFNSEEMKEEDRNSVLQHVNRAVVYYHPNLDVTNFVLYELNKYSGGAQAQRPQIPGPAAAPQPRPGLR